ncbi:MAG: ribonuclease III [Synergistaceae bacterium]|jgi:ribonuclease-3|nr:ribonuclease III [Synergistaceae bacterium]
MERIDGTQSLMAFQRRLGYFFHDDSILSAALCHASYAYEHGLPVNNERLEFLGDAVMGVVAAHVLYETFPEASEGELTRRRVELVRGEALTDWADELEIALVLKCGKSLKDPSSSSIFEDAMEAVVGAVYLDGGFDAASRVIRRHLATAKVGESESAKSKLQALLQARGMELPSYRLLSADGPSHAPMFRVSVSAAGRTWEGTGTRRKNAEAEAAAKAVEDLTEEEE